MNNITVTGNVGKVELKQIGDTALLSFSVASDRNYQKDRNNKVTDWFNCDIWGKRAEGLAKVLTKGCGVAVVGEMQSNKKDDKTYWQINVANVDIIRWADKDKLEDAGVDFESDVDFDSDKIPF